MDYIEAISVIDHNHTDEKIEEAKDILQQKIQTADTDDDEARGTYYYYLLKATLQTHLLFETPICVSYYEEMHNHFLRQLDRYREEVYVERSLPKHKRSNLKRMQLKSFFKLMERYYSSLELLYRNKNFVDGRKRAYVDKMKFRKDAYLFQHDYADYLIYLFFEITSLFGESFLRWGMTVGVFIITFAISIGTTDLIQTKGQMIARYGHNIYDYAYFALISFMTVGYGDITPITGLEKILTTIFVVFGYIMLGMFINLIQKKL